MTLLYGRVRVPWIKAACSSSLISAVTQTFLELSWFMWKLNTALLVSKAQESSWRQVADIRIKDRLLRSAGVYWATRCPKSGRGVTSIFTILLGCNQELNCMVQIWNIVFITRGELMWVKDIEKASCRTKSKDISSGKDDLGPWYASHCIR